jgi:SAM-dependent methyltransferase
VSASRSRPPLDRLRIVGQERIADDQADVDVAHELAEPAAGEAAERARGQQALAERDTVGLVSSANTCSPSTAPTVDRPSAARLPALAAAIILLPRRRAALPLQDRRRAAMAKRPEVVDHYSAHYRDFAADVYAEVRRAAFGEDVGQNSWLTLDELDRFVSRLQLRPSAHLLDVGCGSGGPTLHVARRTGCQVVGVELYEEAVAEATRLAGEAGLARQASFLQADASEPLPFEVRSFDALLCVDSINHLPDRRRVLEDWARLLRPRGRLLFTDPVVITGTLDSEELAFRTSIGYFLFVPADENERLLANAGLIVVDVEDTTAHLAEIARRRRDARAERAKALREIEGDAAFDGRQRFFDVVATLADERRLSRFAYTAEKQT